MSTYFEPSLTKDEAKAIWRRLANDLHPDHHPAEEAEKWTEAFKALNHQYAKFQADYGRNEAYRRQEEAHKEGKKAQADYHDVEELYGKWREVIEAALNLGVEAELIGMWVWVTGPKTYENREALKAIGFHWAHKKDDRTAYFNNMNVPSFSRGGYTLDEIRGLHGSTKYRKNNGRQEEEAAPAAIPATVPA